MIVEFAVTVHVYVCECERNAAVAEDDGEGGCMGQEHPGVNEWCEKNRLRLRRRRNSVCVWRMCRRINTHLQTHTAGPKGS